MQIVKLSETWWVNPEQIRGAQDNPERQELSVSLGDGGLTTYKDQERDTLLYYLHHQSDRSWWQHRLSDNHPAKEHPTHQGAAVSAPMDVRQEQMQVQADAAKHPANPGEAEQKG